MTDNSINKQNILDLDLAELREVVSKYGEKSYRADQIFGWLAKGISSFDEMQNIPSALLEKLYREYYIGIPEMVSSLTSKDGTIKCLLRYIDGAEVESVYMKYSYGNSICISSQAGCRMGCSFCASTIDGLERDLSAGEMLAEVLCLKKHAGEDIGHVVIMGMGEPFDNYDEVLKFIRLIHDEKGYNLGLRNITVSTCGIVPGIMKFAADMPQVNLAVSLHAPNQKSRELVMPIAKKYGYDELMKACREYTRTTKRRISFEYALIRDVNDSNEAARELAARLKGWITHVNIIQLNEVKGRAYRGSSLKRTEVFKAILEEQGIAVSVRRTLGSDIDAACGQLRRSRNS